MRRMLHGAMALMLTLVSASVWGQTYRMAWRGLLLDAGRQYQTVPYVEALLDSMAARQMNVLHWHLTENDGWRMELQCAPRLTQVGAQVATGPEQQGYYTRAEMEHIVSYARERGITVVPEVDVPGHSGAFIAAYPHFGCSDQVLCPAQPGLVPFLCRVLDEVCDIFPSAYIHLGGDEVDQRVWRACPACQQLMAAQGIESEAALQVWMERQLIDHLATRGRTAILWEDVLYETQDSLPANLVIQWWNYRARGEKGLREALRRGVPVILSSNYYCYLNFPTEPWRGYEKDRTCQPRDVAERNPSDLLYDAASPLMLGMEACLWTDYGLTQDMLDQRLYPRLDILARQMRGEAQPADTASTAIR